ncbi:uncharacterized protein LOC120551363 [Perca fluviatilis]|uniref:uncharacterized protein LOC120551363 n=1 Tax=Perca fluviatilis TaxID=8168 RepID=UPI0019663340|nr:uncharacterized protein LOC120551363 [Perca fluviatilis]
MFFALLLQAIVLLCLLGAICVQADYSWTGPGNNAENAGVDPYTTCLMDQASCGCCLMQQQIHRMEMFFNMSLNEMEKELIKTKMVRNNVRASRSAFSVSLTNDSKFNCFRDDKLIIYKQVFINLGNGYSETGIFTVLCSGVYSLALTVYSDAGSPGNTLATCTSLQVNGQVVAGTRDINMKYQEDSATIVAAIQLKVGDKVAVNLPIRCFICNDSSRYNTFTGFQLYATDLVRKI